jgi:hypothetical protein
MKPSVALLLTVAGLAVATPAGSATSSELTKRQSNRFRNVLFREGFDQSDIDDRIPFDVNDPTPDLGSGESGEGFLDEELFGK